MGTRWAYSSLSGLWQASKVKMPFELRLTGQVGVTAKERVCWRKSISGRRDSANLANWKINR